MRPVFVALAALLALPLAARAQEVVGGYVAEIGVDDLYNSEGQRLGEPWQVLRQDRANFHRYGVSQPGDEWDPLFGDADNRAAMERMVRSGTISREAERDIMAGGATVYVTIWGRGGIGDYVEVEVYR